MTKKRNIIALALWALLWTVIIWFAVLVVAGFVVGAMAGIADPAHGAAAGEVAGRKLGETVAGPALLFAFVVAIVLTIGGVLPGTRKAVVTDPAPDTRPLAFDIQNLERLAELHARGVLTDEEFATQKARMLAGSA